MPRVALLSTGDPTDESAWSGMLHASRAALGECADVVDLTINLSGHAAIDRVLARGLGRAHKGYLPAHGAATAARWGRATSRAFRDVDVDAVVAVAASSLTAFADLKVPLISISDSTLALVANTYPSYRNLPRWAIRQARWVERRSWQRSHACIMTSQWARRSLIHDYGIAPQKTRVVPFGPGVPPSEGGRKAGQQAPLRLLLVAADWQRKRGDRAIAVLSLLREMGIAAHLTVVGAPADAVGNDAAITWLPRRNRQEMADLYAGSDIVLDLAEANCASVTLVDAVAWGIPAVATDVGAAREIVADGQTGYVVPNDNNAPRSAAQAVAQIVQARRSPGVDVALEPKVNSPFSWTAWTREISQVLADLGRPSRS